MEPIKLKFPNAIIIFVLLMLISMIVTACASTSTDMATADTLDNVPVSEPENPLSESQDSLSVAEPEKAPETSGNQQIEVMIPIVESSKKENYEAKNAYPDTEQETQESESQESQQIESEPKPTEESVQAINPTPRGKDLVATDPSTVNLASGSLQLVELFAFW